MLMVNKCSHKHLEMACLQMAACLHTLVLDVLLVFFSFLSQFSVTACQVCLACFVKSVTASTSISAQCKNSDCFHECMNHLCPTDLMCGVACNAPNSQMSPDHCVCSTVQLWLPSDLFFKLLHCVLGIAMISQNLQIHRPNQCYTNEMPISSHPLTFL